MGLISRVSSRTYRASVKMLLQKLPIELYETVVKKLNCENDIDTVLTVRHIHSRRLLNLIGPNRFQKYVLKSPSIENLSCYKHADADSDIFENLEESSDIIPRVPRHMTFKRLL